MKLSTEKFKRMTLVDLKNLEQNLTMWFHLKDKQRSVAAAALGLRSSLQQKPSLMCQRASRLDKCAERHSKAVFDCRESFSSISSISSAVKSLVPSAGGVKMIGNEKRVANTEVALRKRYAVFSKSSNKGPVRGSEAPKGRILTCKTKEGNIVKHNSIVIANPAVSSVTCSRLQPVVPKASKQPRKQQVRTDLNANTLTPRKKQAYPSLTPSRGKRFSKAMPLRKIVTLREHQKRCEIRIRELEESAARLRQQKSVLEGKRIR